ncbi:ABC transporter permease [Caulobacter sp. KR2-114]|uniref:ABC transporter permease n=1 Tax=Caulobacter sp. KR2-114 TaxID=3400912 RepID=UPI003BFE6794
MIRLLRIAVRDYLAYVRTPGFWLSIVLMPVGMSTLGFASTSMNLSTPVPAVAVVDLTGGHYAHALRAAFAPEQPGQRPVALIVPTPGGPFHDAASATARLRTSVASPSSAPGSLDAAVIVKPATEGVTVDLWTRNASDPTLERAVQGATREELRRESLARAGVGEAALKAIDALQPQVIAYSPKAAAGRVSLKDKLPGLAGFGMGILLWMVVLTGAGMLLNSVIEEKSSRILEVMLTSASVPEIMGGKILGVACVTCTVMGVWLSLGSILLTWLRPDIAGDLASILFTGGMIGYLLLYFVGGYLMFATLYVTVGAFCETTREAQTLLGPMMILLSVPVAFMSQAITHPDSPLLAGLSWVPIFTPFMMAARAGSDPPAWQVVGTAAVMFATTALELWVAAPAFKSGALASGRFDMKVFVGALVRREAA